MEQAKPEHKRLSDAIEAWAKALAKELGVNWETHYFDPEQLTFFERPPKEPPK
jgi:hypothetical protein